MAGQHMAPDAFHTGSRTGTPLEASRLSASIDPLGDRLHLAAAPIFLFLNPIGSGASTTGFNAFVSVVIIRLACGLERCCAAITRGKAGSGIPGDVFYSGFRLPVILTILMYLGWMVLGLLWASPSRSLGLEDIVSHRSIGISKPPGQGAAAVVGPRSGGLQRRWEAWEAPACGWRLC